MAWASLLRLRAAVDTAAARVLSALGCGDERRRCSPLQVRQEGEFCATRGSSDA